MSEPPEADALRAELRELMRLYVAALVATAAGAEASDPERHRREALHYLRKSLELEDAASFLQLLERFGPFLQQGSHQQEVADHLATALAQDDLGAEQRVRLASLRILLLIQLGQPEAAWAVLDAAWPHATTARLQAELLMRRGILLEIAKQYADSLRAYEQALALAEGDPDLCARLLNNLGNWAYAQDLYNEALDYYHQALEEARASDNLPNSVLPLGGIAMTLRELRRYDEARDAHAKHRAHAERAGNLAEVVRSDLNLGFLLTELGKFDEARQRLGDALMQARKLGDRSREARALHNIGRTYLQAGSYAEAWHFLSQALTQRQQLREPLLIETTCEEVQALTDALAADTQLEPGKRAALLEACLDALH